MFSVEIDIEEDDHMQPKGELDLDRMAQWCKLFKFKTLAPLDFWLVIFASFTLNISPFREILQPEFNYGEGLFPNVSK